MDLQEAMRARHSVRSYTDRPITEQLRIRLEEEAAACNAQGDLRIRLLTEEPKAFGGMMAHYGKFTGVKNYFAVVGKKSENLYERAGYWGERLVLTAQSLGLNTCWVALTFSKRLAKKALGLARGEKLVCAIALGYGETQGTAHKNKSFEQVCGEKDPPAWFSAGIEAALSAPTAMNQQHFFFSREGERGVRVRSTGGFYAGLDLGIVRYHFELGAGRENFEWVE